MDYNMVMLLLINAAVYNKKLDLLDEIWYEVDWEYVKNDAYEHNCLAIVFPAIQRIQKEYNCIDSELYKQWEEEVIVLGAAQCIKNYETANLIRKLENEGISVALFKGAVLAQLYPEELLRVSGDVDLLIEKSDEEKAIKLLESYGYEVNQAASKENVTVLAKGDILVIELHASLWEDYKGTHIDKLKNMHLDDKHNFIRFQGCDIECNTLDITNHFQYIFYHVVKHFIPGGIGIRHLMDIALFYNHYEKDIDMDVFRNNMDALGYTTFYKSVFSLCIAHLGMKNTCLNDNFILEADVYQKMIDDIIDAGVFGNKTIERVKSRNIVKQTYYEQGSANENKKSRVIINTLFPSAESMSDKYVNARKYKFLLPVAWTQRAVAHVIRKVKNKEEPDVWSKAKIAEDRLELLRTLGL